MELVGVRWTSDSRGASDAENLADAFSQGGTRLKQESTVGSEAIDGLGRTAAEAAKQQVGAAIRVQERLKAGDRRLPRGAAAAAWPRRAWLNDWRNAAAAFQPGRPRVLL